MAPTIIACTGHAWELQRCVQRFSVRLTGCALDNDLDLTAHSQGQGLRGTQLGVSMPTCVAEADAITIAAAGRGEEASEHAGLPGHTGNLIVARWEGRCILCHHLRYCNCLGGGDDWRNIPDLRTNALRLEPDACPSLACGACCKADLSLGDFRCKDITRLARQSQAGTFCGA